VKDTNQTAVKKQEDLFSNGLFVSCVTAFSKWSSN